MVSANHKVRRFGIVHICWPIGIALLVLGLACSGSGELAPTPAATSVTTPTTQAPVTPAPPTLTPGPATVEVPIEVQGASNLGSLQLELVYDPQALELQDVRAGQLARNALVDFNQDSPGRVRIGAVDASGISGDGAIIILFFLPIGQAYAIPLTLEAVEASDTDLKDLVVQTTEGRVSRPGEPVTAAVLSFRR